jgi:hypothetical protein
VPVDEALVDPFRDAALGRRREFERADGDGVAPRRVEADRRLDEVAQLLHLLGGTGRPHGRAGRVRRHHPVDQHRDRDAADLAGLDHPLAACLGDLEIGPFAGLAGVARVSARAALDIAVGQVRGNRHPGAGARLVLAALLDLGGDRDAALRVDHALDDGLRLHVRLDVHLHDRPAGPDARLEQALDALLQRLGPRLGLQGGIDRLRVALAAREDHAARRVDHRNRLGRQARHRRRHEIADRLGLGRVEAAAGHGDGDRGRGRRGALEGLGRRVRDVHPRGADVRRRGDGAGEFPLLGAPVGRVEHLARRAEAREAVEELVARRPARRQPLGGKGHARLVAPRAVDVDRGVAHLEGNALAFERGHHLARRSRIEAGIEERHGGRGGQAADAEHRRRHRHHCQEGHDAAPRVELFPCRLDLLEHQFFPGF